MPDLSRRSFLTSTGAAAAVGFLIPEASAHTTRRSSRLPGPVVIASANGLAATRRAAAMIADGADTLEAVVSGVNIVEEDPNDHSVGYGGLPNEDGVVELDSCVMHGPTCRAGAVAAIRNIKTPSRVAKLVMERTDHVMLVGEGALRFARAHGFQEANLLTDESRKNWLRWKETRSDRDDWIAPPEVGDEHSAVPADLHFTYGTINCCALDAKGDLSGVTTTSGLGYKIPGRVGDSPIIGAGLYVDNNIGAAGSTGRGEAVIKICGAHTVVEAMRHGMPPVDACLQALERIVDTTTESRLRRSDGRPNFDVKFYAVAKDGRFGAASIWSGVREGDSGAARKQPGAKYAVFAEGRSRHEQCAYLYKRPEK
jgi:N4-(beta-N-acetylglucosaminyl)-L-asparaginase